MKTNSVQTSYFSVNIAEMVGDYREVVYSIRMKPHCE